jgi:DNA polymerase V
MFALVDCNNFYVSCERVFRPDLNGKPVVVLSNNDGCVISRSNEAKKLGIKMAAPAYQHKQIIEDNNVTVFSSNYVLYGDMSSRVMSILSTYVPDMEMYSIDEAFMDFEGFELYDLDTLGKEIRQRVLKWTGIPTSVGFGTTKALAKVANHIAKKFPENTNGVYVIDSEEKRLKALQWLPIDEVWGIGRRQAPKLVSYGIEKAIDLVKMSDYWVKKNLSVTGVRLKWELEGRRVLELEDVSVRKSIATTRTFEELYTTMPQLKERIASFASSCAEKLRKQHSCCNAVMVFINTNRFREDDPQCNRSIVLKLPYPTNSTIELVKFAHDALQRIFVPGYKYKKAGVVVMDIVTEMPNQLNIFENSNPKHKQLMETIDRINRETGNRSIMLAAEDPARRWKMHQEKLSPRYTTKLEEALVVHAR